MGGASYGSGKEVRVEIIAWEAVFCYEFFWGTGIYMLGFIAGYCFFSLFSSSKFQV